MNTSPRAHEIDLAKKIEAGILAQEILEGPDPEKTAPRSELSALVEQGRLAKEELVLTHLGLARVIAAEVARQTSTPFADLFQEGCLNLQQALMCYDHKKGPFGPYAAMWIRAGVRRAKSRPWAHLETDQIEDTYLTPIYDQSVTRTGLAQVLRQVPSAERQVLQWRTGWEGQPMTRKDIASRMGVTISRVRHLERRGLEFLRERWVEAEAA